MGPALESDTGLPFLSASTAVKEAAGQPPLPHVNVVFVNYNGMEHLPACLDSLYRQSYPQFDVTVVDNASSDNSLEYLRLHFPQVHIVESPTNLGFGRGNNLGIAATQGEYVVFTNYDVEFDPQWLEQMVRAAQSAPDVGIVAPKILLFDQRDRVNACGLALHYAGYASSRGYQRSTEDFTRPEVIASATGCSFLIRRSILAEVGTFDPLFQELGQEFYRSSLEDVDLCWRTQLAGYRILLQPSAKLYHKYLPRGLGALRFQYLEGGRGLLLLKNYDAVSLLVLGPALLLGEITAWGAALIHGRAHLLAKARAYGWLWSHARTILDRRRMIQEQRQVSDLVLLRRFTTETRFGRFFPTWFFPGTWLGRGANSAFHLYYRLAVWLLRLLAQ